MGRRYCGRLGKTDNCQVAVSLFLASAQGNLPQSSCYGQRRSWRDRKTWLFFNIKLRRNYLFYILIIIVGFVIGGLVSIMGGGGGIFYLSFLTAVGLDPQQAVALSLITIVPTTLMASVSHWRMGHVQLRTGLVMGMFGMLGAVCGAFLLTAIISERVSYVLLGGFFVYIGISLLVRTSSKSYPSWTGGVFGFFGGVMSGIFGISGTPVVLVGLQAIGLKVTEIIGTSVFVIFFISLSGAMAHSSFSTINWTIAVALIISTSVGAFLSPLLFKYVISKQCYKKKGAMDAKGVVSKENENEWAAGTQPRKRNKANPRLIFSILSIFYGLYLIVAHVY